mgnify:CR=1 FL=1
MAKENKQNQSQQDSSTQVPLPDKALKNLASSIYNTLKDEGCASNDIITVSSQLLGLVTSSLEDKEDNS